jgi:hypothetical protein
VRLRSACVAPAAVAIVLFALGSGPAAARSGGADGRFDRRTSRHFVLYEDVGIDHQTGPNGSRQFERTLLAALEDGYAQLDDLLGLRPRRPIEVCVYAAADFDAHFGARFRFPAAGFYGGTINVRGRPVVTEGLVDTLHHELLHAALDAAAPSAVVPAWWNEGLAEWFAARAAGRPAITARDVARLRALAGAGALAPLEALAVPTLARLDARDAPVAYLQSLALVDQLVRLRGERALREVVERLVRTGDLDAALVRTARLDADALDRSLRASLGVAP